MTGFMNFASGHFLGGRWVRQRRAAIQFFTQKVRAEMEGCYGNRIFQSVHYLCRLTCVKI